MEIISLREYPSSLDWCIAWFQKVWGDGVSSDVYENCMQHCIDADSPLPQWYMLVDNRKIVGGIGLIANDFNSRQDLTPWLCALFVEEEYRGRGCGEQLLRHAAAEAGKLGFSTVSLCTDLEGYYERYGFSFAGVAYHPWGDSSLIYQINV